MPLFRRLIEHELLGLRLKAGKPMTELEFYAAELAAWEHSSERREMLDGWRYYSGYHDILQRKRTAIGPDGNLVEVDNLPNDRIVDNQYAKHVDQKVNYLLGKPVSFKCSNKLLEGRIKKILGSKFMRTLKKAGVGSFNCGIAWLYPYYDKDNKLTFKYFPGYEILPFWADSDHTELDSALRLYFTETYFGREKRVIKKVDAFKPNGVSSYIFENGVLTPDPDTQETSYIIANDGTKFNWEKFPLIPIKYNDQEIPLIRRCRSLQDAINILESDFSNNMREDARNTILVLKNYDGQNLGEFRKNLTTYGVVKVRTVDGRDGGIDSLEINVNSENYKTILELLKRALIENVHSYDAKDARVSGNPNQMNIQSMYSDIDIDANAMETELQAAFEDILWFLDVYLVNAGEETIDNEDIKVIFNRDILINETEAIDNCSKSVGIISDETIISQHPWVDDPAAELERVKGQKKDAEMGSDPYRRAFEQAKTQRSNMNPDGDGNEQ